jgi:hypothetical protein
MPAKFDKKVVFDGFDPKVKYQMVPIGGVRPMTVVTDANQCIIRVNPQGVAKMQNFVFSQPLPDVPREFAAIVGPNTRFSFDIIGIARGNTSIFLAEGGKAIDVLNVSVKLRIPKTFNLIRLSDMRRTCPYSEIQITSIMGAVAKTYIQQANIDLTQKDPRIEPLNIPRDLGDPLIPDKRLPDGTTIKNVVIDATPLRLFGADFRIYFTWNLRGLTKDVVGVTFGHTCFVEDIDGGDTFQNKMTTAHELGHALGLDHSGAQTLMFADTGARTSLLQQFEIDTINQTDQP